MSYDPSDPNFFMDWMNRASQDEIAQRGLQGSQSLPPQPIDRSSRPIGDGLLGTGRLKELHEKSDRFWEDWDRARAEEKSLNELSVVLCRQSFIPLLEYKELEDIANTWIIFARSASRTQQYEALAKAIGVVISLSYMARGNFYNACHLMEKVWGDISCLKDVLKSPYYCPFPYYDYSQAVEHLRPLALEKLQKCFPFSKQDESKFTASAERIARMLDLAQTLGLSQNRIQGSLKNIKFINRIPADFNVSASTQDSLLCRKVFRIFAAKAPNYAYDQGLGYIQYGCHTAEVLRYGLSYRKELYPRSEGDEFLPVNGIVDDRLRRRTLRSLATHLFSAAANDLQVRQIEEATEVKVPQDWQPHAIKL